MGRQKWGQHFLVNRGVIKKIIQQVPNHFPNYLEIGPGKGVLTEELISHLPGKNIVAVEIDRELGDRLIQSMGDSIRLIGENILDISLETLEMTGPFFIIGNIPYYLSGDLVLWLAKQYRHIAGGILMIQKEFMDKILLHPPTHRTILFRMLFQPMDRFDVSPGSFSPPPKVQSSVFRFAPIPPQRGSDTIPVDRMAQFLKQCFSHRRKTLIKNMLPIQERDFLLGAFKEMDLPPPIRAEEMSIDQFKKLFFLIRNMED